MSTSIEGEVKGKKLGRKRIVDLRHFEERLAEFLQHPFEIGERRRLVDHQPLDLMEHRRVGLVGVAAIGAAGADDADRRLLRQHRAHLHRAGVGAQQLALAVGVGGEEERVVHFARGMAGREVELGEIVVVGFDVRAFGDREAHVGEDRGDFVEHLADRVDAPGLDARAAHRQRHVERLALELRLAAPPPSAPRGARLSASATSSLSALIAAPSVLRSSGDILPKRGEQGGDRALLAERGDAHGFQRGFVARPRRSTARVCCRRAERSVMTGPVGVCGAADARLPRSCGQKVARSAG